jgi:arylamine N-acetyltransferase
MLYKIINNQVTIDPNTYLNKSDTRTRGEHKYKNIATSKNIYKYFLTVKLHEGWRELYTLQTRPEAVKVWSLCYCCREVVPTSDGAGGKRILLYVF